MEKTARKNKVKRKAQKREGGLGGEAGRKAKKEGGLGREAGRKARREGGAGGRVG